MAAQEQKKSSSRQEENFDEPVPLPVPSGGGAGAQASTSGVDDLLDEIDGVLESNAEEFVRGFVQKGGQ